jgi:hypothetical protein
MLSRISRVDSRYSYILGNDGPGAYDNVIANTNRKDGRIGADRYIVANHCFFPFISVALGRAAILKPVVDEHHPMTNKTIRSDTDALTNETV